MISYARIILSRSSVLDDDEYEFLMNIIPPPFSQDQPRTIVSQLQLQSLSLRSPKRRASTSGNSGFFNAPFQANSEALQTGIPEQYEQNCNDLERIGTGGLTFASWLKILTFVADPNGVLDKYQLEKAFECGANFHRYGHKFESSGKGEAHQIWRMLQLTDCLTYEMLN
jgi:hypothetical protein